MTKGEWVVLSHQLDALRAFWGLHVTMPNERSAVCGASWIADYGPLPCDKPQGHDGQHRCYGSQGPIEFGDTSVSERPTVAAARRAAEKAFAEGLITDDARDAMIQRAIDVAEYGLDEARRRAQQRTDTEVTR